MIESTEGLFALPVGDQWLFYAPQYGFLSLVTPNILKRLTGRRIPKEPLIVSRIIETIATGPSCHPYVPKGRFDPQFLGIVPTRTCNFSCRYCAFGADKAHDDLVDTQLFLKAVDWMAAQEVTNGGSTLRIDFFGGEPLVVPQTLETIIAHAHHIARKHHLTPQTEIATNGFCSDRWAHFAADKIDYIVLSLDGPADIQNYHRPLSTGKGSFATVAKNAEIMAAGRCHLAVRVCVTTNTVNRVPDISRWLCQWLKPKTINFEPLKSTPESDAAGICPPDPWEFGRQLRHANKIAAKYNIKIEQAAANIHNLQNSFCPVGKDVPIFCPNGEINACYLPREVWEKCGFDFTMGSYTANGQIHIDIAAVKRIREYIVSRQRCKVCFCRWHCAGGCHVDWQNANEPADFPPFCIQTRITTACRLLDSLGLEALADFIINDEKSLKTLILKNSDNLRDWNETTAADA